MITHRDADGIVSAALAHAFLRDLNPGCHIVPALVDYPVPREWSRGFSKVSPLLFRSPASSFEGVAVTDFQALDVPAQLRVFFADHHARPYSSLSQSARRRFCHPSKDTIIWDPDERSCAHLLLRSLRRNFGWTPSPALTAAADIAHRIDSAAYPSAADACDIESAVVLYELALLAVDQEEGKRIIELLANGTRIEDALPPGDHLMERCRAEAKEAMKEAPTLLRPLSGNAVVIDWSELDGIAPLRFAEFALSEVPYSIRILRPDPSALELRLMLMRSPWCGNAEPGTAHPDMARLAALYGGGGHSYAAGCTLSANTEAGLRDLAERALKGLAPLLTRLEASHPMAESQ